MEQTQQQQTTVQPSLADLDKPAPPPGENNPPALPGEDKKPEETDQQKQPGQEDKQPAEEDQQEDDNVEEQDQMEFYNEITRLRGDNLQFQFPPDMDLHSPAGVHHAMQQVVERELETFERNLYEGDKRAYAYMLHRANGGSDEEFFATKTEVLPEWDTMKNSVDLQQQFYRRVLARKELPADDIEMIVKNAIEKNKLAALVETEYNRIKKQDEDQAQKMLDLNERNQKQQEQMIQKMGAVLQEKIIDNKGLGITIPDAKRGTFLRFVNDLVHLDTNTGRWFIQQEVTSENINSLLESLFYLSVGGNMNEIISNRANQQNVNRLKLNMKKDKTKLSTQADPTKTSNKPGVQPALKDL